MSYCRFSSLNWTCDVYVYESVDDCWMVHVARNRHRSDTPYPEKPEAWWLAQPEDLKAMLAAENDWLKAAEITPINLPHAGESFSLASPGECADTLEMLRGLGYVVPDNVITTLRAEQAETPGAVHDWRPS